MIPGRFPASRLYRGQLSWRLDKTESFSDWAVQVDVKEGDQRVFMKRFYVHRCVLGVGERRSEYFSALFRYSSFSEQKNYVSHIKDFTKDQCAIFPDLLDYMYFDDTFEVTTTKNIAVLYKTADFFGVTSLREEIHENFKLIRTW
jgi:hypothetical protein